MEKNNIIAHKAVQSIIGNMVSVDGNRAMYSDMGAHTFTPEDIMPYFPAEAEIMNVILHLDSNDVPPTPDVIRNTLALSDREGLIQAFEECSKERTSELGILQSSFLIKELYLKQQDNQRVKQQVIAALDSRNGTPQERIEQALSIVSNHVVSGSKSSWYDQEEAFEAWLANQRLRVERKNSGLNIGPDWPFAGLTNLVPYMKRGEMATMMGKSKWGKSTFGGIFAEHWAYKRGYMVVLYLFETSIESYMDRALARNAGIPVRDQRMAIFDPDNQDINNPAIKARKDYLERVKNAPGRIEYVECAMWTPDELSSAFARYERKGKELGLEVVHIVDYYGEIDPSRWTVGYSNAYNRLASWLKNTAEKKSMYLFVLAQEKEDAEDPSEGYNIKKRSQIFMRLRRTENPTEDLPVLRAGTQARDTMGNLRWHHKAGAKLHADMDIQVVAANDDETGSVRLLTEMSLFRVIDHPTQRR